MDAAQEDAQYWDRVGVALGGLTLHGWTYRRHASFRRGNSVEEIPGWLAERVLTLYQTAMHTCSEPSKPKGN